MMDALNTLMQWVVAPVAAFVWLLHRQETGGLHLRSMLVGETSTTG